MWLILEISVLGRKISLGLLMSLRNNANLSRISKEMKLIEQGRRKDSLRAWPIPLQNLPKYLRTICQCGGLRP